LAVTLEVHDNVDQVFEKPWARNRTVLRDVPNENDGNATFLCDANDGGRDFADLCDTTGESVDRLGRNGLHGIDYDERRFDVVDMTEDRTQVGFGGKEKGVDERTGALGPKANLSNRFLGRHVQNRIAAHRNAPCDIEKQR
jgi:hypothetical protein